MAASPFRGPKPAVPSTVEFPAYDWDGDLRRFAQAIEEAGKRSDKRGILHRHRDSVRPRLCGISPLWRLRGSTPITPAAEAWLVVGRRGGKSRIAALVVAFVACFFWWAALLERVFMVDVLPARAAAAGGGL